MKCIIKIKTGGFLSAIYYIIKYYTYQEIEPFKYFLNKYFFCLNSNIFRKIMVAEIGNLYHSMYNILPDN